MDGVFRLSFFFGVLDHAGFSQPEIPTWWPFSKMAVICWTNILPWVEEIFVFNRVNVTAQPGHTGDITETRHGVHCQLI